MAITFGENIRKTSIVRFAIYGVLALLLSYLNASVLNFIQIGEIMPDLVLILVVFITIREGQFTGLFAGFFAGLIFDVVTMDVIGTNALAKTIAAFTAGFFYKEDKSKEILGSFNFLTIVFVSSIIHNLVYFFFYVKVSELNVLNFFLKYGFASSLYTTVLALFPILLNFKRREINV